MKILNLKDRFPKPVTSRLLIFICSFLFVIAAFSDSSVSASDELNKIDSVERPRLSDYGFCKVTTDLFFFFLRDMYIAKDVTYLTSMVEDKDFAKRVVEHFIDRLDPYGIFLFEQEYQDLVQRMSIKLFKNFSQWPIRIFKLQSPFREVTILEHCELMDEIFRELWNALLRHVSVMRTEFSSSNLLRLQKKVMYFERLGNVNYSNFTLNSVQKRPSNHRELIAYVERVLIREYFKYRAKGEQEHDKAWALAHRSVKRLRAEYSYTQIESVMIAWLDSLLRSLDSRSGLKTESQFKKFLLGVAAEIYGLGITFRETMEGRQIIGITPGGAADLQGVLQVGDVIVGIEGGRDVNKMNDVEFVRSLLSISPDPVELHILRNGEQFRFLAKRGILSQNISMNQIKQRITGQLSRRDGNLYGYVYIPSFFRGDDGNHGLARQLFELLLDYEKKGIHGLIIDLRGNPGGSINEVAAALDLFLNGGDLFYVLQTKENLTLVDGNQFFTGDNQPFQFTKPLVILIDGESASSSEAFAGVLQDYRRALVVGSNSFGKGSVQVIYPLFLDLPMFNVLKKLAVGLSVTTGYFFLPSGRAVQNLGIRPDVREEFLSNSRTSESDQASAPVPSFVLSEEKLQELNRRKFMTDEGYHKAVQHMQQFVSVNGADQYPTELDYIFALLDEWKKVTQQQ
ncbi:MAG: S41 family peptidase [Pseudobdellovibrionaceae bacterium]|nr:S41 family peptidase [Pseudobdellovibrionaceae bacterium]